MATQTAIVASLFDLLIRKKLISRDEVVNQGKDLLNPLMEWDR